MGLIGGIIGGIGSAVAGIVGGNATRKAANRNAKILQEMENRNKAWYEQDYYGNYLERADAKAAINETRELLESMLKMLAEKGEQETFAYVKKEILKR